MPPLLPKPKTGILDIAPYTPGKSKGKPGARVVKLSSNETPLGPSPEATAAFSEAAKTLHRYPDATHMALREAIGEVHGLPPERIVCGSGSDELIGLLVHAYAGPGDEVLYSRHGFLMYKIYTQGAGATPVEAPEKNLRADVDALLSCVTPKTKIVFIANPNNPTGSYISKAEMKRLRDGLPPQVILAIDDAYTEYAENFPLPLREGAGGGGILNKDASNKDCPPPQPSPSGGEGVISDYSCGRELVESGNTVCLRTFSKIYGLAALRLGWAYAPPGIIDVLNRIRGPFNVSTPAMMAGIAAVRDTAFTAQAKQFNAKWRQWLAKEIGALGLKVYPSIGNFLLIEFPQGKHGAAEANAFLTERGLILREVGNYGLPDCLRLSVGLEEDNKAVVAAFKDFFAIVK